MAPCTKHNVEIIHFKLCIHYYLVAQYKKPITLISIKYISVFFLRFVHCLVSAITFFISLYTYTTFRWFSQNTTIERYILCLNFFYSSLFFVHLTLYLPRFRCQSFYFTLLKCFRPICNWFWKWCQRFTQANCFLKNSFMSFLVNFNLNSIWNLANDIGVFFVFVNSWSIQKFPSILKQYHVKKYSILHEIASIIAINF